MTGPVRFAIIGAGWRSEFFLRLAAAAPDRLECVGVVARRPQVAQRLRTAWGARILDGIDEAVAARPDFIIAAVSWDSMPGVVADLADRGVRVLAETPPAPDADGLRALWQRVGDTGLVQVAEQYLLMPGHAARKAVVDSGAIGPASFAEVASTHMYHAVSLMRGLLGAGFGPVRVRGDRLTTDFLDPLGFDGWRPDPRPRPTATTIGILDFGDGRAGLYQFVDNQWWNPLLSRRILVRGTRGEIVDNTVTRMTDDGVVTSELSYRRTGIDMNLEGNELVSIAWEGRVVYRNRWIGTRLSEDDLAVADFLEAAGAWARDEAPGPYPLADACQDHLVALAVEEAAATGAEIITEREAWA
ncbi:Gfo/Idh/MocA family protein [Schaalia vaccimaxillae]|uniref:Gfo/Idh/MocA family protein n=1 Tax=Schaalia vaccimaxillae TaxID=183916 RepID=UPI000414E14A|nr:Gfo/Idh/MocA family oxidoreductase [Schaalia vaccimaxillae]